LSRRWRNKKLPFGIKTSLLILSVGNVSSGGLYSALYLWLLSELCADITPARPANFHILKKNIFWQMSKIYNKNFLAFSSANFPGEDLSDGSYLHNAAGSLSLWEQPVLRSKKMHGNINYIIYYIGYPRPIFSLWPWK